MKRSVISKGFLRYFAYMAFALPVLTGAFELSVQAAEVSSVTTDQVKAFIQNMGEKAIVILTDAQKSRDDRALEFKKILEANFDLEGIGTFLVGEKRFQSLSTEQRSEYMRLLPDYIVQLYLSKFEEYRTEKMEKHDFEVTRTVQRTQDAQKGGFSADSTIQVSQKNGGKVPLHVQWRVFSTKQGPRILDVYVNDISMSQTKRDEFRDIIKNGGVDTLIEQLRDKIEE